MATFIAGPCVIESMELLETVAQELVRINEKLGTKSYSRLHSTKPTVPASTLSVVQDWRKDSKCWEISGRSTTFRLQQIFMRVIRLQQQAKFVIFSRFQPSSADRPTFWFLQPRLVNRQHQEGTVPER